MVALSAARWAGTDPVPPEMDWEVVRRGLEATSRSADATAAGLWAVDVLEATFGWPRAWRNGQAPPEIATCYWHLVGFISTLELALTVHELQEVPGFAAVRDVIRGSGRPDQLASPRIQLKLAAVARAAGIEVRLEPPGRDAPADLSLGSGLSVEIVAVLRDDATQNADR